MLKDFLFEIQCAEEIGAYRIADALDAKLLRLATSDHKTLKKQIEKKYSNNKDIKSIDYSPGQHKFIISADSSLPNNIKRDIKSIVEPYSLSFKYSMKNIDELMGDPDPLDPHLDFLKNPIDEDYIGLDEFYAMEPTDDDLRREEEFPAEDISDGMKNIDEPMEDPLHRHIENLLAELYSEREPSAAELRAQEKPKGISNDPDSLDQLYLEEARKNMRKNMRKRKKLD